MRSKHYAAKANQVILVDTSSWIHFLRPKGDEKVRRRVERVLSDGEACWCSLVRLELWNGAQAQREGAVLRDLERALPELKIDDDVWAASFDLARRARAKGITVPATDILIAACALHHGAGIETSDSDFDALNSLRIIP
jgi:predicted nucleic acid-binding protein